MGMKWFALLAALFLTGCGPLKLLGKPGIAANVQAGADNTQAITSNRVEPTISKSTAGKIEQNTGDVKLKTDKVETVTIKEGAPPWIIWALVVAVFLDSPLRWPEQIFAAFRRRRPK